MHPGGVKIAWTVTKAARSSRSFRVREVRLERVTESPNRVAVRSERIQDRSDQCPCRRTARGDDRAAERFILSNARLLNVD